MKFYAQIDSTGKLVQGVAFSHEDAAQVHRDANPGHHLIETPEWVTPQTHQYVNCVVTRK